MQTLSNKRNVVVTGSSGNLGGLIANNLPYKQLTCIDIRNPIYKLPLNANFIKYDITNTNLTDLFLKLKPSTIIHAAFTVAPVKDHLRKKVLINDVFGTKNVLKAAKKAKTDHVIYLSSTLAYGALPGNKHRLKESDSLEAKPNFHYAFHKRLVEEKICIPFTNNFSGPILTILRLCPILGPHIRNYVTEILNWKILPFISEGKRIRVQWLHEFDFIQAIIKVIEYKKNGIFNIAPDTADSFLEQSKYLSKYSIFIPDKLSRLSAKLLFFFNISKIPSAYLDFVRYQFIASNKKAKNTLNWIPRYTSKDAILSIYK